MLKKIKLYPYDPAQNDNVHNNYLELESALPSPQKPQIVVP